MARWLVVVAGLMLVMVFRVSGAENYDFDWVTIGAVGNEPYLGDSPFGPDYAYGRGRVDYEYRIGRTEVTTGQWLEFVNTFSTQSDDMKTFARPFFLGCGDRPDLRRAWPTLPVARQRGESRTAAGGRHQLARGGDVLQLAAPRQVVRALGS